MKIQNVRYGVTMLLALAAMFVGTAVGCGGADVIGGGDAAGDCVVGGCSGHQCKEPGDDSASTCEWREEYACYKQHGVCERNSMNQCAWRQTQALQDCITTASVPPRNPASGVCIRNSTDACTTDADCKTGGCGGELCEGVNGSGVTTCECTTPQGVSCGCVNGTCSWWQ